MPCPGRVGVATDTTGVANDWADWELFILWFCGSGQTVRVSARAIKLPDNTNKQTNGKVFASSPIFVPPPAADG